MILLVVTLIIYCGIVLIYIYCCNKNNNETNNETNNKTNNETNNETK